MQRAVPITEKAFPAMARRQKAERDLIEAVESFVKTGVSVHVSVAAALTNLVDAIRSDLSETAALQTHMDDVIKALDTD